MEKYPGKNEGLERKNHVTFSASRCTGYTYPLKTRRDYHTIPLYKCGEFAEYLPDGSFILQAGFGGARTIIYYRYRWQSSVTQS